MFPRLFDVPEVLEVQVIPSDEVRIVPEKPTTTKVLFPYAPPLSFSVVPEVLEVHVVPSEEVIIVPLSPTATNNGLEVVVVEASSFSSQEKMMKLKRNRERIMSICLIGFLIGYFRRTLHIPQFGGNLQVCGDFTWRVVNMDLNIEERTNKPSMLTVCFTSPWNSIDSYHHHTSENLYPQTQERFHILHISSRCPMKL